MTWANIQTESSSGASKNFILSATSGNLAVVIMSYTGTITSVTDTTGANTYTLAASNTSGTQNSAIYYSVISTGGTFTITANGSLTMPAIVISEQSFTAGSISVVTTNSGQGTGTQASGAYLTFSVQPAFIVSAVGYDAPSGGVNPNPGYNSIGGDFQAGTRFGNAFLYILNATASPALPGVSFGNSVDWSTASAVFVSSGDTGTPTYSTPFSQAFSGGNSLRSNAGHY